MYHIIFVHGISPSIINTDYTQPFKDKLLAKLHSEINLQNILLPSNLDNFITFENVNYSAIGQAEEDIVLNAYEKEKITLYNPLDKIIGNIGFDSLRRDIITSLSDVLIYESDFWREKIRTLLLDKINPYIKINEPVTVIGHSLGSVVAFDTLYYNSRHNPLWLAAKFKVRNLFTLGSPIALFSLELDNTTGVPKPRYIPMDNMPSNLDPRNTNLDLNLTHEKGVWYNFLDAQDLIAYPLKELFLNKFNVKDILVQTGTLPVSAHTKYWKNDEIVNQVVKRIIKDITDN